MSKLTKINDDDFNHSLDVSDIATAKVGSDHPHHADSLHIAKALHRLKLSKFQTATDSLVHEKTTESQAKRDLFEKLSQIESNDHSEVKIVKRKMQKLIQHEMGELGFKKQLGEEEASALVEDMAATKANFFFSINEDKQRQNQKLHAFKAPGNPHRHPSVIVPHEGVHPQDQIDVASLTQDKLNEIYAYYQYLIDLHIS